MIESESVSIVIPTFNGAMRIGKCLEALLEQASGRAVEILVVDDGSADHTAEVVKSYASVRLIKQANAGPATARNRGAQEANGSLLIFTDDDCVPAAGWLNAMLAPFREDDVVGAKGVYRTRQRSLVARFVQLEYEDKYRLMERLTKIDFVDTYAAAFLRSRFLDIGGYDTSFPTACAEDVELSYRMSARGWTMKFAPDAIVFHTHPDTLSKYLRKKYKFAFWRVLAVRKNPEKGVRDSHTPQLMKLQLLLAPALLAGGTFDLAKRPKVSVSAVVLAAFLLSTVPFVRRAMSKDPAVALLAPLLLTARACAQFLGVTAGFVFARSRREPGTPLAAHSDRRSQDVSVTPERKQKLG